MDFQDSGELLQFFHFHKTEMSCMEHPHTFLSQLRDHNLIPEDMYKKMCRMKSKDKMKKALYEFLDWFETKQPQSIKDFWKSVFRETILKHYPTLQELRASLMDGSFHFGTHLPEKVQKEAADRGQRKEVSEEEEEEEQKAKPEKKKRKRRVCHEEEEEEQAGPSCLPSSGQKKKSKKIKFSSPLKKGENGEIWTWPIYRIQLPVSCGCTEGILNRDRLAKGEKCIVVDKQWFTPGEFERFAGKQRFKNWKLSIRCMDVPLGRLIQEGHLKAEKYKGGNKKAKKSLFPSDQPSTVSDREDEGEESDSEKEDQTPSSSKKSSTRVTDDGEAEKKTERQPGSSHDRSKEVFKVTCGASHGTLHKRRFASGTCGKSIRTETSWMTPVEFLKASGQTDRSWRKDIKWEEKPLSVLTEAEGGILRIHSLLCNCRLCKPDCNDLENQKNDDECCICKSEDGDLVECDQCPCSFHQRCHLPHVEDAILGQSSLWICTFCVFRSNQQFYYRDNLKREAAMSRQISQHMLECQYLLLRLCSADEGQTFATDPSLYLENYSTVIKTPIWLGSIANKLQKHLYKTVGEFVSDVLLIFTNCASYNKKNAEVLEKGNALKRLFDEELKNVFNIRE